MVFDPIFGDIKQDISTRNVVWCFRMWL